MSKFPSKCKTERQFLPKMEDNKVDTLRGYITIYMHCMCDVN